jgi:hypothetical protein
MRHAVYVATIISLLGFALVAPRFVGFAALGGAIATGVWFYVSLRGRSGVRGGAFGGVLFIGGFVVAAILVAANSITGDRRTVSAIVTGCIYSTQRTTGHGGIVCTARLGSGGVENFPSAAFLPAGTQVSFCRHARRFVGYHYEFAGCS